MLGFLAAEPEASAGLIIAADVFVYAGALDPVLAQCARVLTPQGRVAFTLQRCAQGIEVGDDLRFAHSRDAVAQSLTRCGFDILTLRDHSTRREKGCDVPGLLAVAVRP
jgi:predicted TPR repeat methyltransferase